MLSGYQKATLLIIRAMNQHSSSQKMTTPFGKMWLLRFPGTDKKNYSTQAAHLICNVLEDYQKHIAYIVALPWQLRYRNYCTHEKRKGQI